MKTISQLILLSTIFVIASCDPSSESSKRVGACFEWQGKFHDLYRTFQNAYNDQDKEIMMQAAKKMNHAMSESWKEACGKLSMEDLYIAAKEYRVVEPKACVPRAMKTVNMVRRIMKVSGTERYKELMNTISEMMKMRKSLEKYCRSKEDDDN